MGPFGLKKIVIIINLNIIFYNRVFNLSIFLEMRKQLCGNLRKYKI